MDFLVTLCASHHLNPSDYTVEFLSPDKNSVSFKPNSPIGSLEAEKMVLKPKGTEEKMKRPYMPEGQVSAEDGPVPEVSLENKNEETIEGALCSSSKPENGMSPSLGFHHNQMKNSPASSLHDQLNSVNTESQKEEAKAPSEVIQSESSECSNEEVNSNHHTRNEDQQSPSPDMESWSSCIDEKKAEEEDVQDEEEEASFPPPPPPVFFKEDMENGASTSSSQQSDSPMNVHTSAQENSVPVSEPSQDKTKVGQSRFAQAVAMAVQRSRLQSLNEDMGSRVPNNSHDALPSPSRSTYQHGPQQTMAHWSDSIQL
uniref:Uncharacterized protein n=1 Tax=Nothobranchius furzeri TaxID=105023 RepID=A0A1A8ULG5_NOTFU